MRPNSDMIVTDLDYADKLVQQLRNKGMSVREIADTVGISKSRLEYLMAGKRKIPGHDVYMPVNLTYPEQYVLEMLVKHS